LEAQNQEWLKKQPSKRPSLPSLITLLKRLNMALYPEVETTRKKVKLRFATAETLIMDKLMIKESEKQVLKRAHRFGSPKTRNGSRNSNGKGDVGQKIGQTSLEKEAKEGKRKGRSSKIPPTPVVPSLTTSELYYVGCRIDQQEKLTGVLSLQRSVEVPFWREDKNHYDPNIGGPMQRRRKSTNLHHSTEEAEPTDDASYLKRHDKHEKGEKQRKRWDAQRLRQEQQLQKLRARQEKKSLDRSKSDSNCQQASLLPAVEEAMTICVEETIPVSVFGRPLPDTGAEDFCLPWL